VLAAAGIAAAVVVSKRRSAVIGEDEPGTPADPTPPPAPSASAPESEAPADPDTTQQFSPAESQQHP
jgi:hypothetical protein